MASRGKRKRQARAAVFSEATARGADIHRATSSPALVGERAVRLEILAKRADREHRDIHDRRTLAERADHDIRRVEYLVERVDRVIGRLRNLAERAERERDALVEQLRRAPPTDPRDPRPSQVRRTKAIDQLAALRDSIAAELDQTKAWITKEREAVERWTQLTAKAVGPGDDSLAQAALAVRKEHERSLVAFQAQAGPLEVLVNGLTEMCEPKRDDAVGFSSTTHGT